MSGPTAPTSAWTDSHCHLQARYVEGTADDAALRDLLGRARAAGVVRVVCVGTDAASSAEAMRIASLPDLPVDVRATVGLHPHEASTSTRGLREVLDGEGADRVVAIGECGLDYFYEHSPRDAQLEALADQVRLSIERDLALVLHVRDAFDDLFVLLGEVGVPERTVVHCFSGTADEAHRCLELGAVISVSGIVTFKNAAPLREAVASVPVSRLMVETDSPFLAPVPHRGRPNEPAFVAVVGAAVAQLVGVAPDELAAATSRTCSRVFRCEDPV